MTLAELATIRLDYLNAHCPYSLCKWDTFNYKLLDNILYRRKAGRGDNNSVNDVIIMADTETSRKYQPEVFIDPIWSDIKDDLSRIKFKYQKTFSEVATIQEFNSKGFRFGSGDKVSKVDIYYEGLMDRYPVVFHEAYSDIDCIYFLYEYMKDNAPRSYTDCKDNHVVAWTISLRAFGRNIVTLWGQKPTDMTKCIQKIIGNMNGFETIFYWHNMAYDWVFMRKFMFERFGKPVKQLNTKPHYPILIKWKNGITFKDSLILAQRSLEKWAKDLNVEHQKAVGKWEYDLLRTQSEDFNADELEYIEHDTLAGVECIDKLRIALNKSLYSMPYTATGIPREDIRKIGNENRAHDKFLSMAMTFSLYQFSEWVFHGGYVHANRYWIDTLIDMLIECYDFASSYPFCMLAKKYPMEAFTRVMDKSIDDILSNMEDYAYMLKLILINPRLKDPHNPMPALQFSKCINTVNAITDNGRILAAKYVEINITELDLDIINRQYDFDSHICSEVYVAAKDYLPRWFTDYIFKLFEDKTKLKGGDPVLYMLAKAKLNSCYGMCVQKPIKEDIIEDYDTGIYALAEQDLEGLYEKYLKKRNTILPYQWGIWVTAYAFHNLFDLGACCENWIYSDTDSCYGYNWDKDKLEAYNNKCKAELMANGYGAVLHNGREYWLGVAEFDGAYSEFKVMGAKRYCGRSTEDNELHITVAGVPKEGAKCLKNDINNFTKGFIFPGEETGKLTHTYNYISDIYVDEYGNETGDSIDLSACDYLLNSVEFVDWEAIYTEEVNIQVYG